MHFQINHVSKFQKKFCHSNFAFKEKFAEILEEN